MDWSPMPNIDGAVKSLKVIDGELIAAGWFAHADTVLANGLARWDGEAWHRVVDVPVFSPGTPNYVNDVEKYNGEWYLGGNLFSSARNLVKWNGSAWETVGGGFLGFLSQVNKLRVYNSRLYVAGSFSRCPEHFGVPSNPGSGIVAWDGSNWDDLGDGTCGASNGTMVSMTWWNGQLYACGIFNRMGGQEGGQLAKWDGERWCMLTPPGFWSNGGPNALAVYNDSLYIGGAFTTAGGEEMSCFVKWVGGDYTYACGAVGTSEYEPAPNALTCFPNPAVGSLKIVAPSWASPASLVRVSDSLGRVIMQELLGNGILDVSDLSSGIYAVDLIDAGAGRRAVARVVRE